MSLALLAGAAAWAGACCVGSTSAVPTRLGECEKVLFGTAVSVEDGGARWDAEGRVVASSMRDQAVVTNLAGAWAWDRKGQVGVLVPLRAQRRVAPGLSGDGSGVGDLRLLATWDPVTERPRGAARALPVPVFTGGLRLPTGTDWTESSDPLLADVTGLPGGALVGGVALERTMGRTPWSLGVQEELGRVGGAWSPTTRVQGMVGRYIGRRWSVAATGAHQRTAEAPGLQSVRTRAGVRVAVGVPVRWRAWIGAEHDVALPGLGRDAAVGGQLGMGALLVR